MNLAVYLPILAGAGIGLGARFAARRVSPGAGAVALTALALVAAAGSAWALALLAATLVDDTHRLGMPAVPVPDPVATAAAVGLMVAGARLVVVLLRRHRVRRRLAAATAGLPAPSGTRVMVLADARPEAYALPAGWRRPSRVFVTHGMLRALDAGQQRALFAHENAHLDTRHHLLLGACDLAAAVNPLLIPVRGTVAFLCERWADERAATETGDRALVASAVAAAALAGAGRGVRRGALAFDRLGVVGRVTALRDPAPQNLRLVAVVAATVGLAIVAADAHATDEFLHLVRAVTGG